MRKFTKEGKEIWTHSDIIYISMMNDGMRNVANDAYDKYKLKKYWPDKFIFYNK